METSLKKIWIFGRAVHHYQELEEESNDRSRLEMRKIQKDTVRCMEKVDKVLKWMNETNKGR